MDVLQSKQPNPTIHSFTFSLLFPTELSLLFFALYLFLFLFSQRKVVTISQDPTLLYSTLPSHTSPTYLLTYLHHPPTHLSN